MIAIADPIKPTTPEAVARAARRRRARRHADRRQSDHGRGRRAQARHRRRSRRKSCRSDKAEVGRAPAQARAASSPWPATASTTRRRSPRRTSASPWERARTWRSKAPASRCCSGDLQGLVSRRRLSAATMSNIRQNLFFAFVYNAAGVPIAAGIALSVLRIAAVADHRRGGDGAVLGQRRSATRCGFAPCGSRSRNLKAAAAQARAGLRGRREGRGGAARRSAGRGLGLSQALRRPVKSPRSVLYELRRAGP